MKFEMNGRQWKIIEDTEKNIRKVFKDNEDSYFYGSTCYTIQKIYINKELHKDQKRQTLMHELMHCYIRNYIFMPLLDESSEETICDISANSHDIIHKIVEKYFNGGNKR